MKIKLLLLSMLFANMAIAQYAPAGDRIKSKWAAQVSPENALSEYPRPMMVRPEWKNLNGLWQYAITTKGEKAPQQYEGDILVPFCIESSLSGVQKEVGPDKALWYQKTFAVPGGWKNGRVLLHFGAVDWMTDVWVNDIKVGSHTGGYTPFTFDITQALQGKQNSMVVRVWDPTNSSYIPHGKQVIKPRGIFYTSVTGIWQTVWLEYVPEDYIQNLVSTPAFDKATVSVEVDFSNPTKDDLYQVEVLFDVATARDCPFKRFDSYEYSPDGQTLLIATESESIYRRSFKAVYYLYSLRRNTSGQIRNAVERLSDGGPQQAPVFSPDGSMVAFMRDNNIYLVKLLFGNSESQVTEDGQRNAIINGVPDWVYEDDSTMLAFIRYDESKVPTYSFPLFAGASPKYNEYAKYPGAYTYKYPKTGETNSKVEVRTFDIQSKVTRTMQVPLEEGASITRIYFTKQPDQLAIITMNRHQNRLDMYMGNARSTVCKLVLRDESDTYIKEEVLDDIHFYDNNFTFTSEKSGFNHLYWYTLQGNLVKQVTTGNYEVKEFLGYSPADETFYFTSNEESPLRKAVYKVDKKGKKTKLSQQVGVNNALFSSNMKYYLNRYTNLTTPTVITLNDNNGKVLTTLIDNAELKQKLAQYNMPKKEFFTFTTSRGTQLNGWMMKPANFDASKKYPVLQYQYSGPGSQQVQDQFSVSWETYMASQGYIVVCVDGRGTGGRGADFEKQTYQNLGVKEAQDQVAVAEYMGQQPYVDKGSIGIWGWSYGG